MKGYHLLVLILSLIVSISSFAQAQRGSRGTEETVIYKWIDGGQVNYAHILPNDVETYTKLDEQGMIIEEYTENFEVIETVAKVEEEQQEEVQEEQPSEDQPLTPKQRNCEVAKENAKKLEGNEIYERDERGRLVPLSQEQIEARRKNTQKDLDYFCSE